jgi:hypothetical protein
MGLVCAFLLSQCAFALFFDVLCAVTKVESRGRFCLLQIYSNLPRLQFMGLQHRHIWLYFVIRLSKFNSSVFVRVEHGNTQVSRGMRMGYLRETRH